jgi:16S rRNA (guanine1207-N2)-methyltransferase
MSGAVKILFLPFETGAVPFPATGENWAFLNATAPEAPLPEALKSALACEQGTRPEFLRLEKAGFVVKPELEAEARHSQGCLVIAGKHRGENQQMIARAARLVAPGHPVIVAGDKNLGIASLRKWVADHTGISGSLAKHHATVFWFEAPAGDIFTAAPRDAGLLDGRFETAPGMFSPGKVDPGSVLLAGHFDKRITGAVADFGCGWGYLSAQVFARGHPESLALYEAHYPSLQAARRNLASVCGDVPVTAHWYDIVLEPVARRFDWIVMNPPFHSGRSAEPDIGKAFIAAASRALKPGGRLLMVANRKLPYEQALIQGFRRVLPLEDSGGFKVFEAVR